MVVRQVGEGGGREAHAVEPVLVEAVARRLDRQMVDALARQRRQSGVELHRIGRGEAGLAREARRDDARACRGSPPSGPSAAQIWRDEVDGRGLAVGAGDGGDGRGCRPAKAAAISASGGADWRRARRRCRGRAAAGPRRSAGEDRRGAALDGVGDEGRAVGLGAGEGGEQEAGLDLARVERQAGQRSRGSRRRSASALPMSSLSRNATHSRRVRPPLIRAGQPATPCARAGAIACTRRHDRRRRHGARHRRRGDLERRQALLQVARQDAVERHDVLDDRLDLGADDHAAGRVAAGLRRCPSARRARPRRGTSDRSSGNMPTNELIRAFWR